MFFPTTLELYFGKGDNVGSVAFLYDDDNQKIFKYELMQSTALLDKNGKEIFEGDILRNRNGTIATVKWIQDRWNGPSDLGYFQEWHREDLPEIVGNIYENPELLTQS